MPRGEVGGVGGERWEEVTLSISAYHKGVLLWRN